MFHTKIKLKYFLNIFHFKIQILTDHISRRFQSAVGPVSSRPFASSPLSIVDRVRQLRPNLTQNEQIIEKNTKNEESAILMHSVALSRQLNAQNNSVNEYVDQYKRQDLGAR